MSNYEEDIMMKGIGDAKCKKGLSTKYAFEFRDYECKGKIFKNALEYLIITQEDNSVELEWLQVKDLLNVFNRLKNNAQSK